MANTINMADGHIEAKVDSAGDMQMTTAKA